MELIELQNNVVNFCKKIEINYTVVKDNQLGFIVKIPLVNGFHRFLYLIKHRSGFIDNIEITIDGNQITIYPNNKTLRKEKLDKIFSK